MKKILNSMAIRTLVLLFAASVTFVQAFAQDRVPFRQAELDQMLAPIALYPDPLLSQILMASTYPLEVVQAARWLRSNPHLKGQDAVKAAEPMDWDPSVKSLTAFPQVLSTMDEKLDWTQRLGEAFIAQQPQVMDTIQGLRQRAAAAGNLRSDERARVTRQGETILIEPPSPQVVYVPYYDPWVVYGPWWWPAYPPVFWGPPPGYYIAPVYAPGFFWGSGIVIGTGFFFGHFNWPHRHVIVVHHHPTKVVVNRQGTVIHQAHVTPDHKAVRWQHDPRHRKGIPFRHSAMRDDFRRLGPSGSDARREHHRPDAVPVARHKDGERPAGFRDERREEHRNSGLARDGRETAPRHGPTPSNDPRVDGRARVHFDRDTRESSPARPVGQGNDRRSELFRDTTRAQSRSMPAHPAPMPPVARTDTRPAVAVPSGNGRQAAAPERTRHPEARGTGDHGLVGRNVTTLRDNASAPRPSAGSGNPAPRMGNGSHRSDGGTFRQGGEARRQNNISAR